MLPTSNESLSQRPMQTTIHWQTHDTTQSTQVAFTDLQLLLLRWLQRVTHVFVVMTFGQILVMPKQKKNWKIPSNSMQNSSEAEKLELWLRYRAGNWLRFLWNFCFSHFGRLDIAFWNMSKRMYTVGSHRPATSVWLLRKTKRQRKNQIEEFISPRSKD